jgi:RHH-type proline utilization regulon transcriptional repressor/proline dehydrogenase/delta 1-pyrroline-5-carboxylate dehydrogenase
MRQAIEQVRETLGNFYPLLIGHEAIKTPEELISVDPSQPSQIIGRTSRATVAHVEQAVAVATNAFSPWRAKPARQRVEILRQAAERMRQQRFALAALVCLEAGKPWREADADVCEAIDFIEWYARQALYLSEPQRIGHLTGEINHYLYEPRGVAAVIAPWNFPLAILTGMSAAALVSGNTVILKPAEQTPVIAAKLVEIYREAGVPAGVTNYLPGLGEQVGAALVRHPQVHIIAFTGSQAVGLNILRAAADVQPGQRHIKRVITEMGGKNAIIVDDDADLDEAVAGVVTSAFGYAGQKCSAASRVIVLERIYDALLHRVVEATRSLIMGAAWEPATFIGPVIEEDARRRILTYIERGHKEGKPVLIQEVPKPLQQLGGYYVAPAIFAEVSRQATIACEEIFGPVLALIRVRDFDDALAIAMDSNYHLTGGIFSRSPAHIARARQQFRVGNLYINRQITGARVGRQPFGGLGLSGTGFQSGGPDYLKQFVETRVIAENTLRRGFADEGVV